MTGTSAAAASFPFDNTYSRLPARFFARQLPTPVRAPRLVRVNAELAGLLGLDADQLASPAGVEMLAGNRPLPGAEPIATAYAGHQFGNLVPQLGDGRAILLGEIVGRDGIRRDIQLKGAGRTPFSRSGDGRAGIGPVLREYIVSEAMAALGIPTTRALAAVTTGEVVVRERAYPGAILTRVAESHIRVGTFQYFAIRGDIEALTALADHVIARHYPEARGAANPYAALLDGVVARQAALVARWMSVGFIHGVMNTDNCSIAGETIDYGPCAFMDAYHPDTVYSSIDHMGRYAYANQPAIAQWNLARLAEALLPLLAPDRDAAVGAAQEAIDGFADQYTTHRAAALSAKVGLPGAGDEALALAGDLLKLMTAAGADYTLSFRRLADAAADPAADAALASLFEDPAPLAAWLTRWRAALTSAGAEPEAVRAAMRRVNPAFIPRNHRVEDAIVAAAEGDDLSVFERLVTVLARPYDDQPDNVDYTRPPRPEEVVQQTFCGT